MIPSSNGIPLAWLDGGGQVRGRALPTWFGHLSLVVRREDGGDGKRGDGRDGRVLARVELAAAGPEGFRFPVGGVKVDAPFGEVVESATLDGVPVPVAGDTVEVRRLPAAVVFAYKSQLRKPR